MVSDREKGEPVFSKVLIKKFVNQLGILTHPHFKPKKFHKENGEWKSSKVNFQYSIFHKRIKKPSS
jgi:hypothetical protein